MRSQGISQFYLHTPCSSVNGMNHTCLCLPSRSWSSFTYPEWMGGWVGLGGWLDNEINVRHRELNPSTVTHPSTNRAQRRLTSLIETNALPLSQITTVNGVNPKSDKILITFEMTFFILRAILFFFRYKNCIYLESYLMQTYMIMG